MMSDALRIEPGHESYDALLGYWQAEGGARITRNGSDWLVIRDNDKIVFVRINSASGMDSNYGTSSMPNKVSKG